MAFSHLLSGLILRPINQYYTTGGQVGGLIMDYLGAHLLYPPHDRNTYPYHGEGIGCQPTPLIAILTVLPLKTTMSLTVRIRRINGETDE